MSNDASPFEYAWSAPWHRTDRQSHCTLKIAGGAGAGGAGAAGAAALPHPIRVDPAAN